MLSRAVDVIFTSNHPQLVSDPPQHARLGPGNQQYPITGLKLTIGEPRIRQFGASAQEIPIPPRVICHALSVIFRRSGETAHPALSYQKNAVGSRSTSIGIRPAYGEATHRREKRLSLTPHSVPEIQISVGVPHGLPKPVGHPTY